MQVLLGQQFAEPPGRWTERRHGITGQGTGDYVDQHEWDSDAEQKGKMAAA